MVFFLPQISNLALAYNSCNRSDREEPGIDRLGGGGGGGESWTSASPFPVSQSPKCCNTVVLPPQLPAIARRHNVCELCVNQTVGVRPSRLGGLPCSFFAIEAALDSFYLKGRTFSQVVSRASALCSNFLSSYSPFGHYTACCRTVHRGAQSPLGSPETPPLPSGGAFSSHGKRWREEPPGSVPHIEEGRGLLRDGSAPGPALAGLSCRTNKTLNLFLLDSNLFWMFAERLGASPRLPSPREFAAIVDLKEEAHYVLHPSRALIRSHLGMARGGSLPLTVSRAKEGVGSVSELCREPEVPVKKFKSCT